MNRGNAKSYLEDYYGAISDFNRIIEIDRNYVAAFKNRGINKEKIQDMKGACSDWRRAASLGDQDAQKWARNQC